MDNAMISALNVVEYITRNCNENGENNMFAT